MFDTADRKISTKNAVPSFVTVAGVAAELAAVQSIAKEISLSVKNARAIAARAGDKARGFQPITDFIDEMATETMRLVKRINEQALVVSRIAVTQQRTREAQRRFELAKVRADDAIYVQSLEPSRLAVEQHLLDMDMEFRVLLRKLNELLDDITQRMGAARVITTRSRIEASTTKEYRTNLEAIAERLDEATDAVRETAVVCRNSLSDVLDKARNS